MERFLKRVKLKSLHSSFKVRLTGFDLSYSFTQGHVSLVLKIYIVVFLYTSIETIYSFANDLVHLSYWILMLV